MHGKIDFEKAAQVALQNFKSWLPRGKQSGKEYVTLNPKREDRTIHSFSINTETGVWADFAGTEHDKGGDCIALYAYLNNLKQGEAAKEILEKYGHGFKAETAKQKPASEWKVVSPIPADVQPPTLYHHLYEKPSRHWLFSDEEGARVFYVARYELEDGEKQIIPWSYCANEKTGKKEYRQKRPEGALPVYNLARLTREPQAPVLIVEGEKAADAAQLLLDGWVVTTWHGGTNAVKKTNWQTLAGRDCVLWPDADLKTYPKTHEKSGQIMPAHEQPGFRAMAEIQSILKPIATARIISLPPGKPDGWDAADAQAEGWTAADILQILKKPAEKTLHPFRSLGVNSGDHYHFISGRSLQMVNFAGSQISKRTLLTLAPLDYWEREYAAKTGPDWDRATDDVIQSCIDAGTYDPRKLRGRGAWWDSGRVVLHLGDRLMVNGRVENLHDFESEFIYEPKLKTGSPDATAATADEAKKLLETIKRYQWESPLDPYFLAGWAVVAPICGALSWRPHVWLTGPSGSGKSYIQSHVVRPLLGSQSIVALGKSSEAGIRQELSGDALPVIIDEAEGHDQRARENVKNLLFLARGASSEGEANTFRGTISGKSQRFSVRSSFLFSSIGVGIEDGADESRITVVSLRPDRSPDRVERWQSLKADSENLLNNQFCESIRARTISLIPKIRENARIFAKVASDVLGNQRIGDQIGILLAGAYSLTSDDTIEIDEAAEMISRLKKQIVEQAQTTDERDEEQVLSYIVQAIISANNDGTRVDLSAGEIIQKASGKRVHSAMRISESEAFEALLRIGIRVNKEDDAIYIANKHQGIQRILKDTPWASNYARMLKRLPAAQSRAATRFGPGVMQRCTMLPLRCVLHEEQETLFEDGAA